MGRVSSGARSCSPAWIAALALVHLACAPAPSLEEQGGGSEQIAGGIEYAGPGALLLVAVGLGLIAYTGSRPAGERFAVTEGHEEWRFLSDVANQAARVAHEGFEPWARRLEADLQFYAAAARALWNTLQGAQRALTDPASIQSRVNALLEGCGGASFHPATAARVFKGALVLYDSPCESTGDDASPCLLWWMDERFHWCRCLPLGDSPPGAPPAGDVWQCRLKGGASTALWEAARRLLNLVASRG